MCASYAERLQAERYVVLVVLQRQVGYLVERHLGHNVGHVTHRAA